MTADTCARYETPAATLPRRLPRPVAFVATALSLTAFFFAAGAPTPLLVRYQQEWGFAPSLLTLAFGAYAIGLLAALRLSGRDVAPVVDALDPQPVRVDRERAWQALLRDKKRAAGAINLVLLGDDGPRVEARPADEVRAALDTLIAG